MPRSSRARANKRARAPARARAKRLGAESDSERLRALAGTDVGGARARCFPSRVRVVSESCPSRVRVDPSVSGSENLRCAAVGPEHGPLVSESFPGSFPTLLPALSESFQTLSRSFPTFSGSLPGRFRVVSGSFHAIFRVDSDPFSFAGALPAVTDSEGNPAVRGGGAGARPVRVAHPLPAHPRRRRRRRRRPHRRELCVCVLRVCFCAQAHCVAPPGR